MEEGLLCRIAGHTVRLETNDPVTAACCQGFLTADGAAEATFFEPWNTIRSRLPEYPFATEDELLCATLAADFYDWLLLWDGLCLHASALVWRDRAWLFSAASGTGKSTHAAQWRQAFADEVTMLDDDKPILTRAADGSWLAHGTLWRGKEGLGGNRSAPLGGIFVLERGNSDVAARLSAAEALPSLFSQTPHPFEPDKMSALLEKLDALIREVPVFRLVCTPTPHAARVAREAARTVMKEEY